VALLQAPCILHTAAAAELNVRTGHSVFWLFKKCIMPRKMWKSASRKLQRLVFFWTLCCGAGILYRVRGPQGRNQKTKKSAFSADVS